jgi:hypothetical protein
MEKPRKISKAAIRGDSSSSSSSEHHDSKVDDEYFKSYSWVGIHEEMIKDAVRT